MPLLLPYEEPTGYTTLGLFSGAGGLDLGFEAAGFQHTESNDILDCAVSTLRHNRPGWDVVHGDVREYSPSFKKGLDVLLAGFPCQGFSLGGKRDPNDTRNTLYREVLRVASVMKPRAIVMENVLNLRTMVHPGTGKPFADQMIAELDALGYHSECAFFRVSEFGVPQTRRRFIFVAFRSGPNPWFEFPITKGHTRSREFLEDLVNGEGQGIPNHDPTWDWQSNVHVSTGGRIKAGEPIIPIRISRTASDGNPVRSYEQPFPAIDTATVWGFAQGKVSAERVVKDRTKEMYIRNPDATAKLWRISAQRMRTFTAREYARLQTFPDSWEFIGNNKRDIQLQIGNAVPVNFAKRIAMAVRRSLEAQDGKIDVKRRRPTAIQVALEMD
ncbi:MAG: DNA (cytosine-5-)-methyltransferase [Flavobacteriales bacterium]|jgi:DNA (cytosine-5)-methyltransferase 1|nr:DNA (cytosine-5-)-methyltransferase [Flavobacteriales bacterium]